jgi:formylmethanofuran dehydrogenase subunit E
MSKIANHLHKYKKVNLTRDKTKEPYIVYKCLKPTCTHYMPIELAEGNLCECNRCGEPMIITRAVLVHSGGKPMAKPHCPNCIKRRKSQDVETIAAFLNKTPA